LRAAIKERFNIDATGGRILSPVIRNFRITASHTRNPLAIPDSCLPAGLREFVPVCTGPKWLTEGAFLPSTIRHQTKTPDRSPIRDFFIVFFTPAGPFHLK
jgi:hypothetical protein